MEQFLIDNIVLISILSMIWCLPWKAVALWKSARNNQKAWFIVMFLLNTLAVLEIIYIFAFSKKKKSEAIISEQK